MQNLPGESFQKFQQFQQEQKMSIHVIITLFKEYWKMYILQS